MPPPMKSHVPSPEAVAFVNDLKACIGKHQHLSPQEMLAGASQLVGNLIALQDQRRMTVDMAMQLVTANIESGNAAAMSALIGPPAGRG